jgi:16S rRNA (adenine1518-N6/adenine1519-N6)-dimethyltransferase
VSPRPGDALVEIGPGLGALTAPLIEAAGALTALEIDRDLADRLQARFGERLTLVRGDALAADWGALATAAPAPLRIVGNLPYHISTPLLFALLPIAVHVRDQHFMLQKEVVDRMVAPPDDAAYGRLSVMLQRRYVVTRCFNVPAGAFSPPPKVASSIVRLVPRPLADIPEADEQQFAAVVGAAFMQRRKTLRNALAGRVDAAGFAAAGVDPGARAETLDGAAFAALARAASRPLSAPPAPPGRTDPAA